MTTKTQPEHEEWTKVWEEREKALIEILGPPADFVEHAVIPFQLGGGADVIPFPSFVSGMTYVTAELTGPGTCQHANSQGHYELMICTKAELEDAANLIGRLAHYSCDAVLEPLDTMDLKDFFGDKTLRGILFANPKEPPPSFRLHGQKCGLLLCIGITTEEMDFANKHGEDALLALLKDQNVFPYTIPDRKSVELEPKPGAPPKP